MTRSHGPDFICVGMPKAGTGWLYDQLDAHPDFWMPPVKELVYLNKPYPPLNFVDDNGAAALTREQRLAAANGTASPAAGERRVRRFPLHNRDVAFLKYASTGRGKPRDLDFYAGLFAFKGDLLSGDITPPYCNIESHLVSEIGGRFPETKILLLVRDPVARVWSRICMAHAGGKGFDTALLSDAAAFHRYLQDTHKLGGLSATQTYRRWRAHAPNLSVRYFFFDHIVGEPQTVRRDILEFLGANPNETGSRLPPDYNRKAKAKLEMPPLARAVLVHYFKGELLASAEIFGGPAVTWPAAYGLS